MIFTQYIFGTQADLVSHVVGGAILTYDTKPDVIRADVNINDCNENKYDELARVKTDLIKQLPSRIARKVKVVFEAFAEDASDDAIFHGQVSDVLYYSI